MKVIKELAQMMEEQVCDAEEYAKKAVFYKPTDPVLAEMFLTLSKQELEHSEMEHKQAVRLINEQSKNGKMAPEAMKAVWDWEHERLIEETAAVKAMHEMYNKS